MWSHQSSERQSFFGKLWSCFGGIEMYSTLGKTYVLLVSVETTATLASSMIALLNYEATSEELRFLCLLSAYLCLFFTYFAWDSVLQEKIFQFFASVLMHLFVTGFVIWSYFANSLGNDENMSHIILGYICLMQVTYLFMAPFMFDTFGWHLYKRVGACIVLQSMYRLVQVAFTLQKLDIMLNGLLVLLASAKLWTDISDLECILNLVALFLSIFWGLLGQSAIRKESVPHFRLWLGSGVLAPCFVIYKFFQFNFSSYYTTYPKERYLQFYVIGGLFLAARLGLIYAAMKAYRNFNRGLKERVFRNVPNSKLRLIDTVTPNDGTQNTSNLSNSQGGDHGALNVASSAAEGLGSPLLALGGPPRGGNGVYGPPETAGFNSHSIHGSYGYNNRIGSMERGEFPGELRSSTLVISESSSSLNGYTGLALGPPHSSGRRSDLDNITGVHTSSSGEEISLDLSRVDIADVSSLSQQEGSYGVVAGAAKNLSQFKKSRSSSLATGSNGGPTSSSQTSTVLTPATTSTTLTPSTQPTVGSAQREISVMNLSHTSAGTNTGSGTSKASGHSNVFNNMEPYSEPGHIAMPVKKLDAMTPGSLGRVSWSPFNHSAIGAQSQLYGDGAHSVTNAMGTPTSLNSNDSLRMQLAAKKPDISSFLPSASTSTLTSSSASLSYKTSGGTAKKKERTKSEKEKNASTSTPRGERMVWTQKITKSSSNAGKDAEIASASFTSDRQGRVRNRSRSGSQIRDEYNTSTRAISRDSSQNRFEKELQYSKAPWEM